MSAAVPVWEAGYKYWTSLLFKFNEIQTFQNSQLKVHIFRVNELTILDTDLYILKGNPDWKERLKIDKDMG